jgi:hypothetical protein
MASESRAHNSWVTSHTECPNCRAKFNFRHSKWGSISAIRAGPDWIFVCPSCHTKQSFHLNKGEVEGLPLITDGSFSVFLIGTVAATITLLVSILALYFVTSRSGSPAILEIGFVPSLIVYLVFMLYWGVLMRKAGRSNIVRQWPQ